MRHTKFDEAVRMASILPAQEHFLEEAIAARWLGMAPSGLARLRKSGNGPVGCRLARRVLYRRSDLLAWAGRQIKQAA